jgi:transcription elongation factor Spt5
MSESKNYYIVKTKIGFEEKVIHDMNARLLDFGSLKDIRDNIGEIYHQPHMRGYIIVESDEAFFIEKLIGKDWRLDNSSPLKNVKGILGKMKNDDALEYIQPKSPIEGFSIGMMIEISKGAFRGERAIITDLIEKTEIVTLELFDSAIPMTLKLSANQIRAF